MVRSTRAIVEKPQRYTCAGAVRGECGVSHRNYDAAHAHCERDHRDVVRSGHRQRGASS
jgi:hypothetical protein